MTKGIILAGGSGTRLRPLTEIKNKHTFLIYDKPMIFYSLSTLMLMGIKEILIISDKRAINDFKRLLGNGRKLGINISYKVQSKPRGIADAFIVGKKFLKNSKKNVLILGDNLFYGSELQKKFSEINIQNNGCSIILCPVKNPYSFGNVVFDKNMKIINLKEKMKKNKNNLAVTGIYFFDEKITEYVNKIKFSKRGELEIVDLLKIYLKQGKLEYTVLNRGYIWYDMGTVDSINEVNSLISSVQNRNNMAIGNIHEVSFLKGYINKAKLKNITKDYDAPYYDYLKNKYF
jgi:glucose-1-phosphate thymidylyltransferase